MKGKRVGLEHRPAIVSFNLILVAVPVCESGNKSGKDARIKAFHRVFGSIPGVEIPHNADGPRVGSPQQKTVHSRFTDPMTAKGRISLLGLPDIEQVNLVLINILLIVLQCHIL